MTLFSLFFILSEAWAMQLVGRAAPVSQYSEFNIIRHRARSSHNESRRLLTLPCQPGACTSPCAPDVRPNAYSHVYQRRRRDPPPSNYTMMRWGGTAVSSAILWEEHALERGHGRQWHAYIPHPMPIFPTRAPKVSWRVALKCVSWKKTRKAVRADIFHTLCAAPKSGGSVLAWCSRRLPLLTAFPVWMVQEESAAANKITARILNIKRRYVIYESSRLLTIQRIRCKMKSKTKKYKKS